jgi:hypothetical protein
MKAKFKLNLDPQALQELALGHIEKVIFAVVVVIFAIFVFNSLRRDRLDWGPKDLIRTSDLARTHVLETSPSVVDRHGEIGEVYLDTAKRKSLVNPGYYMQLVKWDMAIWEEPKLRDRPRLYEIEDLRVAAGHCAVANTNKGEGGNASGVEGIRWVMVTGLIPYKKQLAAYDDAFKEAQFKDPKADVPGYVIYNLERAELAAGQKADDPSLVWQPIKVAAALQKAREKTSSSSNRDPVDDKYLLDVKITLPNGPLVEIPWAYPLPSMVNRRANAFDPSGGQQWSNEAAHSPEIPTHAEHEAAGGGGQPLLGEGATFRREGGRYAAPTVAAAPADAVPDDLAPQAAPADATAASGKAVRRNSDEPDSVSYRLFRYLDTAVDAGKRYAYRVRARLLNPNFGVKARYLVSNHSTPAISDQKPGTLRNNLDGEAGVRFTTGAEPLVVTQLGMWVVAGNRQAHTVKLADATDAKSVASASISTSGATAGRYTYQALSSPVTLLANHSYYLTVSEANGKDQWLENDSTVTSTGDLTINNSVFYDTTWHNNSDPGHAYGLANMKYVENLAKAWLVDGPWSEPSPVVAVPVDTKILAGPMVNRGSESGPTVYVVRFDVTTGDETFHAEKLIPRGQLLNFRAAPSGADDAAGHATVDYDTDAVLLNFWPSNTRRTTEPASILIMDRDGNLSLRNEVDDAAEVKALTSEKAATVAPVTPPPKKTTATTHTKPTGTKPGGADPLLGGGAGGGEHTRPVTPRPKPAH